MDLLRYLSGSDALNAAAARHFAGHWRCFHTVKGAEITRQGAAAPDEFILLDGQAASLIVDPDGREVCVGLYLAPCPITPQLARTREGQSLVTVSLLTDGMVARLDNATLTALMVDDPLIRQWGDQALRAELGRKADREWCLAALGGAQRLQWFRAAYHGYEDHFPQKLIASFLGMTPVSLSRLRHAAEDQD